MNINKLVNMEIYKQPFYYEIAFSFINPKEQVDNFEKIIHKFSKIKVNRFLDIACGPSLQLREIARRGYEAIGLDLYPEMLVYLRKKAKEERVKIETIQANMYKFRLKKKADFAFIMMGSLDAESNEKFLSHLDSVAASLNKGGLYFIQNMTLDWTQSVKQKWTMERDGITVEATFESHLKDILRAVLGFLSRSPAYIVLINLEDLWLETHAQNIPSTTTEHPNWRRKARYGFESCCQMPRVMSILEVLHALRPGGGSNGGSGGKTRKNQ